MRKYVIPILGATVIIVLIITVFKVTSKKVSESPFETQAVETASAETQPEIVVHNEGEDKVNIDDLDVSVDKPVYETVCTTEIVETDSDGNETVDTIGVVETEAYGGFVGVDQNGDTYAGYNSIPLSSGHQYTEYELTNIDNLIHQYTNDETLGESFIDEFLSYKAFNGLSDTDKAEIKSTLLADYPHNGSVDTSETLSETTESYKTPNETNVESSEVNNEIIDRDDGDYYIDPSTLDGAFAFGSDYNYGENPDSSGTFELSEEDRQRLEEDFGL